MGCNSSKPEKNSSTPGSFKESQNESKQKLTSEQLGNFKGSSSDIGSIDIEVSSSVNVNVSSKDSNHSDFGSECLSNHTTEPVSLVKSNNAENKQEEDRIIGAISKIQRQARRKRAMMAAHAEQQWKMFADLDTQDEAEMLHLAVFMQTLIDLVPSSPENGQSDLNANRLSDVTIDEELRSFSESNKDIDDDKENGIKLSEVVFIDGSKRIAGEEFNIPKGPLSPSLPKEIMEVYKKGGHLGRNSVVKILRAVYKVN